jgi:hypothetical protein
MNKFNLLILAALSVAAAGSLTGVASAQAPAPSAPVAAPAAPVAKAPTMATFHRFHSRRAEVAHRLKVQAHRIRMERKAGLISPKKAAFLKHQDRMIRREIRFDASKDNGKITRAEQRTINMQENHVARELAR